MKLRDRVANRDVGLDREVPARRQKILENARYFEA